MKPSTDEERQSQGDYVEANHAFTLYSREDMADADPDHRDGPAAVERRPTQRDSVHPLQRVIETEVIPRLVLAQRVLNNPAQELHVPALLEMLAIPYSGAGPAALARCYDKFSVGRTAAALGVSAPVERVIWPEETDLGAISASWAIFPAFLKLNAADNSFGIMPESLVNDARELLQSLELFRTLYPEKTILLQEFLQGREYRLCLLGNSRTGFVFLPIAERTFTNADSPYVTYYYKYNPLAEQASAAFRSRPCTLPPEKQQWLHRACITLFGYFGCRDYATFDFREDAHGTPKILDVNPNPSWDKNSMINSNDEAAGYFYPDALRFLIASAQARYAA